MIRKQCIYLFTFIFCTSISVSAISQYQVIISGKPHNDLAALLDTNQVKYGLYSTPSQAIAKAGDDGAIILLATQYPNQMLNLSQADYEQISKKNLRVFIEFPHKIPGAMLTESPFTSTLERAVVNTTSIQGLDSMAILGLSNVAVIPFKSNNSLIVMGKVAGFRKADFGITDIKAYPLLFKHNNFLIASTSISNWRTARFGPSASWQKVWSYILNSLYPSISLKLKVWPQDVRPLYKMNEKLPTEAVAKSVKAGVDWFYNSRLLVHPQWEPLLMQRTGKSESNVVHPAIAADAPIGNGSLGILEGHTSKINNDGSQPWRWWIRADCQAGAAQALAASANYLKRPELKKTAQNLLTYLYTTSNLRAGPRSDPQSPSFGLVGWATPDADAYYGDDNARVILSTIEAGVDMQNSSWNQYILEAIIGNFRTAGEYGFRGNWFRDSTMQKTTWQKLSGRKIINIHPHYESWLWACYLWLYDKTGYEPLLSKAKMAIKMTMEKFPKWKWTNGIQQEKARMILPLAWLVRIDDQPQHRQWLDIVVKSFLDGYQSCGAIREELGEDGMGKYGRITSNAEYGLQEAPLISKNGDPVADLLYTMNFGFFSLNEAATATGNPAYTAAVNQMRDFLVKVQVHSPTHADLNGTWFRAFDYSLWDYWGSNADSGWGPWCTETGWIQNWILTTMVNIDNKSNFWDKTKNIKIKKEAGEVIRTMLK